MYGEWVSLFFVVLYLDLGQRKCLLSLAKMCGIRENYMDKKIKSIIKSTDKLEKKEKSLLKADKKKGKC